MIFLIAICLFISIPKFFDYEKKSGSIRDILIKNYNLDLIKYSSIKFDVFPFPHLIIKNADLSLKDQPFILKSKNFKIFLNIQDLYNYRSSSFKKIKLNENKIKIEIYNTLAFLNFFKKQEKKISIKNLNLTLNNSENIILELKNVNFFNYGHRNNKVDGLIFDKKFEAKFSNKDKKLNFRILKTGIDAELNFDEIKKDNSIYAKAKINILKNYIKLNFKIFDNYIDIKDANLRNRDLSVSFDSNIKISPFFELNNIFKINKIDKKFIENLNLQNILSNSKILKKLNSKNKIISNQKTFRKQLVKIDYLNLNLSNGIIEFSNKNFISGGISNCKGESIITEEYPRLHFNCQFSITNKNKLFKEYSIQTNFDKEPLELKTSGSINLVNKKINFKQISTNTNYIANEEDMNFYKGVFENLLLSEGFFKIFNKNKIKDFLLELI